MLPAHPKPAFDWSDARTHSSRRNQDLPVYTSMCKVFVITTVTFTLTLWVHNYSPTHPPIPLALHSRTAHGSLECNKNDRLTDRPLNYSKIKVLLLHQTKDQGKHQILSHTPSARMTRKFIGCTCLGATRGSLACPGLSGMPLQGAWPLAQHMYTSRRYGVTRRSVMSIFFAS